MEVAMKDGMGPEPCHALRHLPSESRGFGQIPHPDHPDLIDLVHFEKMHVR
jgi:hypothetical protein